MGIVVFGAVFVDIKGYPNGVYIPGGRNVGRIKQVHGGVSRNVAENIANIELKPTFVSVVDDSGFGQDVINNLNDHHVNTQYMLKTPDGMGTWLAVFNHNGDVVASISKRPDLSPLKDILDKKGDEIFKNADSIVVEFDMDEDILKKVFFYAEKNHKKVYAVISNMSIAQERREMLKDIDCLVCNKQEAEIFFQEDYAKVNALDMANILKKNIEKAKISKMVVTMGPEGAVYAEAFKDQGYTEARTVDVIDTTGAGDSFFTGVAIGLTYGKTLKEACEIGTRLAASVIGTTESVCPHFMPEEFGL